MKPYYEDNLITLYCGDMREVVPALGLTADAIITDPPYGETSLEWDRWPEGWVKVAESVAPQMWCFGSMRMFLERRDDFAGWRHAQEIVWEKHNGSGFAADRFKRVHELALHFYRGKWGELYNQPPRMEGGWKNYGRRNDKQHHTGVIGGFKAQESEDRLQRSVIQVRSCHKHAVHPTQKPGGIVRPLLECSVPPGGLVVDFFSGSGTTLAEARETGRRAIGIEGKEEYCEAIVKRLSQSVLAF